MKHAIDQHYPPGDKVVKTIFWVKPANGTDGDMRRARPVRRADGQVDAFGGRHGPGLAPAAFTHVLTSIRERGAQDQHDRTGQTTLERKLGELLVGRFRRISKQSILLTTVDRWDGRGHRFDRLALRVWR